MSFILHELENKQGIRLSPYCWRIRMALKHKGLDFTTVGHTFLDIPNINSGQNKMVPVLETEGRFIGESHDIATWLDQNYPEKPLVKGGLESNDTMKFVYNWLLSKIHPAMSKVIVVDVRDGLTEADQVYFNESRAKLLGMSVDDFGDSSQAGIDRLLDEAKPMMATLESQDFLGGSTPNYADYIVFGNFMWARLCSDTRLVPEGTALEGWWHSCLDLFDGYARAYLQDAGR